MTTFWWTVPLAVTLAIWIIFSVMEGRAPSSGSNIGSAIGDGMMMLLRLATVIIGTLVIWLIYFIVLAIRT